MSGVSFLSLDVLVCFCFAATVSCDDGDGEEYFFIMGQEAFWFRVFLCSASLLVKEVVWFRRSFGSGRLLVQEFVGSGGLSAQEDFRFRPSFDSGGRLVQNPPKKPASSPQGVIG